MITSDGTTILGADDKAGLAAIIEMLHFYQDKPHPTIELALDICEEIGLRGAFQIDLSKLQSKKAIILDVDGAPGRMITSAPYQDICKIKIEGKPSHAGIFPEKGISAIQTASIAIANMRLGRLDAETTANIGTITGGKATNIVAAECFFNFEARSISEQKLNVQVEHMLSEIEKACTKTGAKFTVEREHVFKGYSFPSESKLLKLLTKSANDVAISPKLEVSGGGSVANVFNAKGLETCVVSCGMENPHTLEEKILVCDLEKTTQWIIRIVELVGGGLVRKLIALLTLILTCILPAAQAFAAPEVHFDWLNIPDGLFEKQSFNQQRNLLLNELINQLHLYEQYFGKSKVAPGVKVILSGNDMTNFDPSKPLVNGKTIYLIQTSDDYSNIGKFNTIFEQLIFINNPNADFESAEIIASFLKYKYFGVNIPKIASLYRYCFPNQYFYDDRLKSGFAEPFNQTVKMLAVAKINELDSESDPKLKTFLSDCLNSSIFAACDKHYIEFPAFIRSSRLSLPNLKIKDMLLETENERKLLLSGMHFRPNRTDIQLRLDSWKDLDAALIFISQGDDVKSGLMLVKVETYLENIASVEKSWWIALAVMILVIMACFLYVHNRLLLANTLDIENMPSVNILKPLPQQKKQQPSQARRSLQQTNANNKLIKPEPIKPTTVAATQLLNFPRKTSR